MSEDHKTCILCGRPTSGLPVCYRCFFNYDYRSYDPKPPAPPARLKHRTTVPELSGSETESLRCELPVRPDGKALTCLPPSARRTSRKLGFLSRFRLP